MGQVGYRLVVAILVDPGDHRPEGAISVALSESIPRDPDWHGRAVRENAEAADLCTRRLEAEREDRTGRDRLEGLRAGFPEVDLLVRLT